MRKHYTSATIFFVAVCLSILSFYPNPVDAGEHGCKVLLCLASPKGPAQYGECRPPLQKLYRDLYNWKPFPKCDTKGSGISVEQGAKRYHECEEYGEGWERSGGDKNSIPTCRKFAGMKKVEVCNQDYMGYYSAGPRCRFVQKKKYVYKEMKRRAEPHYVQLKQDGQDVGQAFYYKKKRKKKKGLW